jgi:hypothetical protein
MNIFGNILLVIFCLFLATMYCINIKKLIDALNKKDYSITTIARVAGIFVVFLGILMGFV